MGSVTMSYSEKEPEQSDGEVEGRGGRVGRAEARKGAPELQEE